jgi:hypothetical protein
MRRLAIEINDSGLIVADETGVVRAEPGCVTVDRRRLLTGKASFARARLEPRVTSFTHWANLSIEAGTATVPGNRSTAELAHAQLQALWQEVGAGVDQVVFVVPGTFGADALGVLLGLAEECRIPAGALVDAAVAASVRAWPGRQLVHLDADLNRVILTGLEQSDAKVAALAPVTLASMGLAGITDAFARRVAELFVLGTRFDPFHRAVNEQRLYDTLGAALTAIDRDGRARIVVADDEDPFEIEVERGQLLGAVQGFYRAVRQLVAQNRQANAALVVQVSERLASLPGFEEELARLDATTLVPLEHGHAARAVLAAAESLGLDDPSVRLFRHLPWREAPAEAVETPVAVPRHARPEAAAPGAEPRPTHVVYRGIAYPVNGAGIVVGRSKLDERRAIVVEERAEGVSRAHCEIAIVDGEVRLRDLSSFGTFVNERRIDGDEVLKAADVIRVGSPGAELTVVRVEDDNGA